MPELESYKACTESFYITQNELNLIKNNLTDYVGEKSTIFIVGNTAIAEYSLNINGEGKTINQLGGFSKSLLKNVIQISYTQLLSNNKNKSTNLIQLSTHIKQFQQTLKQSIREEQCPESVFTAFKKLPEDLGRALAQTYAQVSLLDKPYHEIEAAVFADPRLLLDLQTPRGSIFDVICTSLDKNGSSKLIDKVKKVGEKTKRGLEAVGDTKIDRVQANTDPEAIKKPVRAVMVSAECSGLVKEGGLAEVTYSLPLGLLEDNPDNKVRLIFPDYDVLPEKIRKEAVNKTSKYGFSGADGNGCEVYKTKLNGIKVYFVKPIGIGEDIFNLNKAAAEAKAANPQSDGRVGVYCGTTEKIHERFFGFNHFAAEVAYKMQSKTDILHLHDWHAAGVARLLAKRHKAEYLSGEVSPVVVTYHNNQFGAQGVVWGWDQNSINTLKKFGIKETGTNFLLDGMNFADMTTTVSPHFAVEAQTKEKGEGIDRFMRGYAAQGRMVGIINGANPHDYNPETNPQLKSWKLDLNDPNEEPVDLTYGPNDPDLIEKKQQIAQKLKLWFDKYYPHFNFDPNKPLVTFIGRLNASQKGVELFKTMAEEVERAGGQFLIMGSQEDEEGTRLLDELVKEMPNLPVIRDKKNKEGRFEVQQGTRERSGIGALVRAATNYTAVPSSFEPCGLVQFEGWLFGAQALGAKTGGLVSSINEEGPYMNGYLFERNREDLRHTLEKAFAADKARTPEEQRLMVQRLIEQGRQYGWATAPEGKNSPVQEYRMVYEQARKNALEERNAAKVNLMLS